MKRKLSLPLTLAAAAVLLSTGPLSAANLGDPAAPLKISQWIKGKPVDLADGKGKNFYVVEFWATWCPPCRTSIPHLTEMQKKFKDKNVIFIGVSDETAAKVKPFVEKMGDKMDYVVALDDDSGTSKGYMEAFGINGIPHAFVVDKEGLVAWQGHPMAGLEEALDKLTTGKYDLDKEKKRASAAPKLEKFMELAMEDGDPAQIAALKKELEALDAEVGGIMEGKPFKADEVLKMVKFQKAFMAYQQAMRTGAQPAKLEELFKAVSDNAPADVKVDDLKADLGLQLAVVSLTAALESGEAKDLTAAEEKLAAAKSKNPQLLNEAAWALLDDPRIKQRNYPLALQLAKAAVDGSEAKDASILDTYARALFESGKTADAIAQQKKAIEHCEDSALKADLEKTLKKYEAAAKK